MSIGRRGLDRTTLKIIAIISMVIDHTAWGFVDFYSPLGQIMHMMGRLTLPIMCFFVAEGFRKTSSVSGYVRRMTTFAIISIIPFYIFFHQEYGYRQNIIFDLMLGLLVLTTLESTLPRWAKVLIAVSLFATSALVGGWVIMPILFILIFYYGVNFRQKALLFCIADVALVIFLMIAIALNSRFHFSKYDWLWWDKSYLLGFMLALPLLAMYNGKKGKPLGGKYFFYAFYPIHFLVLALIRYLIYDFDFYEFYLGIHVIALLVCAFITVLAFRSRPARGQNAIILFMFSAMVYIFGFVLEILARDLDAYFVATLVQYFGEVIVMMGLIYYIKVLFNVKLPFFVYIAQMTTGFAILAAIATTRETGFFYKSMEVVTDGPISHLALTYGPGFYLSIAYIVGICIFMLVNCIRYMGDQGLVSKRARLTMMGIVVMWLPYLVKLTGLTRGYEFPAVGVLLASITFYLVLTKYNFLDSVALASGSVLDHGQEGIIVLGSEFEVQFQNKPSRDLFGELPYYKDIRINRDMEKILVGEKKTMTKNDRIYEFRIEEIRENNTNHGFMIWSYDATDRIRAMRDMTELATRDNLTGLYNRIHFSKLMDEYFAQGGTGCFFMVDMDNFKKVNDQLGHQVGDAVLKCFGRVLKSYSDEHLISCRVGGDEFMGFYKDSAERIEIVSLMIDLMKDFSLELEKIGQRGCTSLSIGTVICGEKPIAKRDFSTIYSIADEALYAAKEAGKNRYYITKA